MKKGRSEKELSKAEKRRLELLERTTDDLVSQGYVRKNLSVSMVTANVLAVVLLLAAGSVGGGLYYFVNHDMGYMPHNALVFIVTFLFFIVVHELIHGYFWSMFTPNGFKDIEFGIMKSSLTPYCTCLVPLKKSQYIVGAIMPFLIMGVAPMVFGIVIGFVYLLFWGVLMVSAATGDIMIIVSILKFKTAGKEVVFIDHPTEPGCVVFEK